MVRLFGYSETRHPFSMIFIRRFLYSGLLNLYLRSPPLNWLCFVKRILLKDDDPEEAEIFRIALLQVDQTTLFNYLSDGMLAINLLKRNKILIPSIIFLDISDIRRKLRTFISTFVLLFDGQRGIPLFKNYRYSVSISDFYRFFFVIKKTIDENNRKPTGNNVIQI